MKNLLTIVLLICSFTASAQSFQIKRAIENLEEGDLLKAEELIVKAYEKDSLDPSVKYAMALLYENNKYKDTNLDTAHYFILQAKNSFKSLNEKDAEKMEKSGIDLKKILKEENTLDSLSFIVAMEINSVSSYTRFLKRHPNAKDVEQATRMRYDAAWKNAKSVDTYTVYREFFETYPNAPQVEQAQHKFETLYFKSLTGDGKLQSYKEFLTINPDSPYRSIAEREILEISTVLNTTQVFEDFLDLFPKTKYSDEIINQIYHIEKENNFTKFKKEWWNDSLRKVNAVSNMWKIPILSDNNFRFLNEAGKVVFDGSFDRVLGKDLCQGNNKDFVLIPGDPSKLINLMGTEFFSDNFTNAEDLGYGLIKIENFGKVGLINKTGRKILPIIYSDIKLIDGSFIAYKQNESWGLISFFERTILKPLYDSIEIINNSILLTLNGRHAITTKLEISKGANDVEPNLVFIYDEYEIWTHSKVWVRSGEKEGLINLNSSFDIPLKNHRLIEVKNGYISESETKSIFYDLNFEASDGEYSEISTNLNFHIYRKEGSNYLLPLKTGQIKKYDSLKLFGELFAISIKRYNEEIIFSNAPVFELKYDDKYELLKTDTVELLKVYRNGATILLDSNGKVILDGKYDKIDLIGTEYLSIDVKNKKYLFNVQGRKLVKTYFDLIVSEPNGGATLLKEKEIGYFNQKDSIYIHPRYKKKIEKLNKNAFKVSDGDSYGIINKNAAEIAPIKYENIEYWNDSTFIFTLDKLKSIVNPISKDTLYANLSSIKPLDHTYYKITKDNSSGVIDSNNNLIIPLAYTFIRKADRVFIAEKYFNVADYYVVVYYNLQGELIRKQGMDANEYDAIYCED